MPDSNLELMFEAWAAWVAGATWRPSSGGSAEEYFRAPAVLSDDDRKRGRRVTFAVVATVPLGKQCRDSLHHRPLQSSGPLHVFVK